VVNRGIERRQIFRARSGYERFVDLLSALPRRFDLRVHGYVLMPNHYHLQIETPRANLSRAIQWLNVSYSIWFNRKYQRVGPLFQGRFKAILHDCASHGLRINRYIHLNPVRVRQLGGHEGRAYPEQPAPGAELAAARVEALQNYRWSSYSYYSGKQKAPEWLTIETIPGLLNRGAGKTAAYRRELEEAAALGQLDTDWKSQLRATMLLGPIAFENSSRDS
jgi:putative transposase